MNQTCKLIQRRNICFDQEDEAVPLEPPEENCQENNLTLMEETLLLYLDQDGYIPFMSDCLSPGLRACILVELELRGRISMEKYTAKIARIQDVKILIKSDKNIGEVLLDEALKHIKETHPPESIDHWISCFSGTVWNPLKLKYHLKFVRERVAKGLVEKGILIPEKKKYLWFEKMAYPSVDNNNARHDVVMKIREALLGKWKGNAERMDKRVLALIVLADISDVLDQALGSIEGEDNEKVMKRLTTVFEYTDKQSKAETDSQILFALFAFFTSN